MLKLHTLKAIKDLKTSRSGGPDTFFINGSNSILPYLHVLFNVIFNKGYFPSIWFEGYIVPIHKNLGGWAGRWCWVASSTGASCYFCI